MSALRFAVDTGGTFTDLVVEDPGSGLSVHKAPTTPDDPGDAMLDVLGIASTAREEERAAMLARGETLIYATTRAINAIVTGTAARTALLTTAGHEDMLVLREGGREGAFDFSVPYPEPYVPRELTFGIGERIGAAGEVVVPLDEEELKRVIVRLSEAEVEAVGVCLLWSIANEEHERRVGEMLAEQLPDVPVTLSSELNPSLREYRRASSAVIDASLKPVMSGYLRDLDARLRSAGFQGETLVVSSSGGLLAAEEMARAPIHLVNSGPAMAPVAGRHYARRDAGAETVIVTDTGGTTFDVSLVRDGRIPRTRETWLGRRFVSPLLGLPSVDVRSMGAGGGSIASVDSGGMLRVGPESAGADPGPVAYGRGGERVTLTDAALVLGYLDPKSFLGGTMQLNPELARTALETQVARPMGLDADRAAAAIVSVATELMAGAIEDITVKQGTDPAEAVLIAGGGAAGLNLAAVARRLGCRRIVLPETGAVLSAAGALISPMVREYSETTLADTAGFALDTVNATIERLIARCRRAESDDAARIELSVEARYRGQVWELETPVPNVPFGGVNDVESLRLSFEAEHEAIFGYRDPGAEVEFTTWRARTTRELRAGADLGLSAGTREAAPEPRSAYFPSVGRREIPVTRPERIEPGSAFAGPGIVQSGFSTLVLDQGDSAQLLPSGGLLVGVGAPVPTPVRSEADDARR